MTKPRAADAAHADEILTAPIVRPSKATAVGQRNPANAIPGRAIPEAMTSGACKMMGLGPHMCRWPMAMVDGERTFCGRQQLSGDGRYCAEHVKRAGPSGEFAKLTRANDARLLKKLGRRGGL